MTDWIDTVSTEEYDQITKHIAALELQIDDWMNPDDPADVDEDALTVATLPAFLARFNPKWNARDIAYRLTRARSRNPIPCTRINGELMFSKEKIQQWIKGEKEDVRIQTRKR